MAKQTITNSGQPPAFTVDGGLHFLSVAGTFGGATITLQYRRDASSSFVTLQDDGSTKSITAALNENLYLPGGELKAVAASAGGSTDITFEFYKVTA
tara:strand:+ start:10243 stop:10533 length:291 start_codon:yes stop_codon:yes gene_type:complete